MTGEKGLKFGEIRGTLKISAPVLSKHLKTLQHDRLVYRDYSTRRYKVTAESEEALFFQNVAGLVLSSPLRKFCFEGTPYFDGPASIVVENLVGNEELIDLLDKDEDAKRMFAALTQHIRSAWGAHKINQLSEKDRKVIHEIQEVWGSILGSKDMEAWTREFAKLDRIRKTKRGRHLDDWCRKHVNSPPRAVLLIPTSSFLGESALSSVASRFVGLESGEAPPTSRFAPPATSSRLAP